MGGIGSGRCYGWSSRKTADSCRQIDINRMKRDGILIPGTISSMAWTNSCGEKNSILVYSHKNSVELSYNLTINDGKTEKIRYTVFFDRTSCNYGGERIWFLCPEMRCGRRVSKLYLSGKYFLCRHCHNLSYGSQREQWTDRMIRKTNKIRMKIGGKWGSVDTFLPKPKGMHWKTYHRLKSEANNLEYASLMGMMAKFHIKMQE